MSQHTVTVRFPCQHRHLLPDTPYNITFGEAYTWRNDNAGAPKGITVEGPNKDAFLKFEKEANAKKK